MQIKITYKVNRNGILFDQSIILPVNPEAISITESVKSQSVGVLGGNDRSVLGSQNLKIVDIASFFPKHAAEYSVDKDRLKEPKEYIKILTSIVREKRFVELSIFDDSSNNTKSSIDFYMKCHLTKFNFSEKGGSLDISYALSFQERKEILVDWKLANEQEHTLHTRSADIPVPKTYIVASGDTLWKISQRVLGDGDRWKEIYSENKEVIGSNPNLIKPGQRLVLTNVN